MIAYSGCEARAEYSLHLDGGSILLTGGTGNPFIKRVLERSRPLGAPYHFSVRSAIRPKATPIPIHPQLSPGDVEHVIHLLIKAANFSSADVV